MRSRWRRSRESATQAKQKAPGTAAQVPQVLCGIVDHRDRQLNRQRASQAVRSPLLVLRTARRTGEQTLETADGRPARAWASGGPRCTMDGAATWDFVQNCMLTAKRIVKTGADVNGQNGARRSSL
jgi:hypothetical protein